MCIKYHVALFDVINIILPLMQNLEHCQSCMGSARLDFDLITLGICMNQGRRGGYSSVVLFSHPGGRVFTPLYQSLKMAPLILQPHTLIMCIKLF